MENSKSAPSLTTPGHGWAQLSTHMKHQRAVKMCCGVDIFDGISDHDFQNVRDSAREKVEEIRENLIQSAGKRGLPVNHKAFPTEVTGLIAECIALRDQFMQERAGILPVELGDKESDIETITSLPLESHSAAIRRVWEIARSPTVKGFCRTRLELLESKFDVYNLESRMEEVAEQMMSRRDFLSVPKVDTHLHNSAMMTARELSSFMHEMYERDKDREYNGSTVGEQMLAAGFEPSSSSVDMLSGSYTMFQNFDNFNKGFTPLGSRELKKLFLGTDALDGEYLYTQTKRCADRSAVAADAFLEPRYSVYGNNDKGWASLAKWYRLHAVDKTTKTLLAVQLPRVYPIWRKLGMVQNFGEMLRNFWEPLFAAAKEGGGSDSDMAYLLPHLRMLDSVDDESKEDFLDLAGLPSPDEWTSDKNPSYSYYHYYMHVNLAKLNKLTGRKVALRPHAGEAGGADHLAAAYLFCDGISHGINLEKEPVLQYLYYLSQVPIAVSPISNSVLFLKYRDNPFPQFFKRGLCVTLTTDDPLMFHSTPTPLLEEYATAKHSWDLSSIDMCEIARYSCLAAFGEDEIAVLHGEGGDDVNLTNIPKKRLAWRKDMLNNEMNCVRPK